MSGTPCRWFEQLLDFLLPPACPACAAEDQPQRPLCPRCTMELERLAPDFADEPPTIAPYHYGGPIRRAIHRLKYEDHPELAQVLAAGFIRETAGTFCPSRSQLVVPVPLHAGRLAERGYNQAALLAREVARVHGLQIRSDGARRVRATARQVGQHAEARVQNLRDAFTAARGLNGREVWIMDDVVTTGATTRALTVALEQAGAKVLGILALARAASPTQRLALGGSDNSMSSK